MNPKWRIGAAALAVAALVSACGGGSSGDGGSIAPVMPQVIVVGDSLSDSGTFGYKFTVQGQDSQGQAFKVWPEIVADRYAARTLCARYTSTDKQTLDRYTVNTDCTNYAVGDGKINALTAQAQPVTTPFSILQQIKDAGSSTFAAKDLVLIDGGSNDAAELIGAFLKASASGDPRALMAMVATQVDVATLNALAAEGSTGMVKIGAAYMQQLALTLVKAVKADLLDKGAKRVVILNIPAITRTPRFTALLGQLDPALATQLAPVFDGWVQAFNASLHQAVQGESRIAEIDFYTNFVAQIANPSKYAYTNVTVPACVLAGVDDGRLDLCKATLLSAANPPGTSGSDWWKRYMFSNSFHPTPYGYEKMSEFVLDEMVKKGWQ